MPKSMVRMSLVAAAVSSQLLLMGAAMAEEAQMERRWSAPTVPLPR
ncbi:hypothetical protein [Shewanella algae]|nr:hypothetical protein [Shewanella algae]